MELRKLKMNFNDCIGKTPLIKLKIASQISGCNIYGKCEFLNPGGSVKDRPALQIVKDAMKKKLIDKIPAGILGTGQDVANCVAFLASEDANYINGETIHVNGGMYMA